MTSNEILQADVLDILFDNRNKEYGAYALRKEYHMRLCFAVILATGCSFGLLFFFSAFIHTPEQGTVFEPAPVELRPFELPAPAQEAPKPLPATKRAAPPVAQEHFTDMIAIVPDTKLNPQDMVPPATALASTAFGGEKTAGDMPGAHIAPPAAPAPSEPTATNEPAVYEADAVEEAAVFPGGAEAFNRYLARQLGAPEGLEQGEMRTAKVQFIISKDGTVLAIGVLQSAGAGLDALILKALNRSPKWKPARQHGAAVPVKFTLPVTFMGPEE